MIKEVLGSNAKIDPAHMEQDKVNKRIKEKYNIEVGVNWAQQRTPNHQRTISMMKDFYPLKSNRSLSKSIKSGDNKSNSPNRKAMEPKEKFDQLVKVDIARNQVMDQKERSILDQNEKDLDKLMGSE